MVCVLSVGVAACYRYGGLFLWGGNMSPECYLYCVVVWQIVIGIVCVFCGGLAACYMYGVCTVCWCVSV